MSDDRIGTLILSAQEGDFSSLEQLYLSCKDMVFALALSILRVPSAAEQITRETFVQISRFFPWDQEESGKIWILCAARSLALAQWKRRKKQLCLNWAACFEEEKELSDRMLYQVLQLRWMTTRQVVLLRTLELSFSEIALTLSYPAFLIRWIYYRAIRICAVWLARTEEGEPFAR